MQRCRILVADPLPIVRMGLHAISQRSRRIHVIGEAGTIEEALKQLARRRTDVVVLEPAMPDHSGPAAVRLLLEAQPGVRIVVYSTAITTAAVRDAFSAGATGFLNKDAPLAGFGRILEQVAAGTRYIAPGVAQALAEQYAAIGVDTPAIRRLTMRELEVVQLMAQGKSTKEIAACLNLSPRTIDAHRANIRHKLNLHTAAAVVDRVLHTDASAPGAIVPRS